MKGSEQAGGERREDTRGGGTGKASGASLTQIDKQEKYKLELGKITLVARWIGLGLIVLTWIQVIPLILGWVGFGLAALSFVLEAAYKKNLPPPNNGGNPE